MNTEATDLVRAIGDYLHSEGLVPAGGMAAHVDYLTAARVTVLNADGTESTSYVHFHSPTLDACAEEGMAGRALRAAQARNT